MSALLGLLAALCYALSGTAAARVMAGHGQTARLVMPLAALAMLLHFGYLALALPATTGTDFGVLKTGATAGLLITLLLTAIHSRKPLLPLLPPTYFIATVVVVVAVLVPEHRFYDLGHKPAVVIHIALSLSAYALFNVCALLALLVAFIQHRLKQRKMGLNPSIPSLVGVEQLLQQLLVMGIVVLTAAVATGLLFLDGFWGQGQAHKAILTCAALLFYIGLWWRQRRVGIRGRLLVIAHVSGALLLTLAYFGSRLIREVLLERL